MANATPSGPKAAHMAADGHPWRRRGSHDRRVHPRRQAPAPVQISRWRRRCSRALHADAPSDQACMIFPDRPGVQQGRCLPLLDEIDLTVREGDVEIEIGILVRDLHQHRHDAQPAERYRQVDPQGSRYYAFKARGQQRPALALKLFQHLPGSSGIRLHPSAVRLRLRVVRSTSRTPRRSSETGNALFRSRISTRPYAPPPR